MQQWTKKIGAWFLTRKLKHSNAQRSALAPKQVSKGVIILFDASLAQLPGIAQKLAGMFQEQGFKTERLGFFPDSLEHPEADFSHFNEKSLSWNGAPNIEMITNNNRQHWEMLICLHDDSDLSLQWLASAIQARLKIGTTSRFGIYDIVLEGHAPGFATLPVHLQNVLLTLKKQSHAFA
jgi:hypothetical protein